MPNHSIDHLSSQRKAAKVAGGAYLFWMIGSILHHSLVELNLIVADNTATITRFIVNNELLFRVGIVIDLVLFTCGVILALALFILLRTIHKHLALLALILLSIQAAISVVIEFTSFIALLLLGGEGYLSAFNPEQLQAFVGLFLSLRPAGYNLAILFFSPGAIIFAYLFFKSRFIPRALAASGILAYSLMLAWAFVKIIVPNYKTAIVMSNMFELLCSLPVMLFQIVIGIWLLVKRIDVEQGK